MIKTEKKILIVEDEKPMARALELKLNHSGFTAMTASNGEDGLALIEKEKFDLILLDLMMPQMNGFDILEALQQKGISATIPVIILSNLSQAEDIKRTKELGAKEFFVKSNTSISTIVDRVTHLLTA